MIFDTLSNLEHYAGVVPQLKTVAEAMDHDDVYDLPKGRYKTPKDEVSYEVVEYSSANNQQMFCFHKNKTVVQIILEGKELLSTSWRELANQAKIYDKITDTGFFDAEPISVLQGAQGRFSVFLPGEPYKSGVSDATESPVKKVIFTINEK